MRSESPLLKTLIICAAPLLACSTYYTLEQLGDTHIVLYIAALIACPMLLLGSAAATAILSSGKRTGWPFWTSLVAMIASTFILSSIWF